MEGSLGLATLATLATFASRDSRMETSSNAQRAGRTVPQEQNLRVAISHTAERMKAGGVAAGAYSCKFAISHAILRHGI